MTKAVQQKGSFEYEKFKNTTNPWVSLNPGWFHLDDTQQCIRRSLGHTVSRIDHDHGHRSGVVRHCALLDLVS